MRELDYVLPCNVTKEVCTDLFNAWAKDLWFAPSDLIKKANVQEFKLLYLPHWLFEVEAYIRYSVMLGFGRKDPNWVSTLGSISQKVSDMMVPACDCPEVTLLPAVEPWKLDHLQPLTLKHTESAEVVSFSMDEETAWNTKGKERMDQICKDAVEEKLKKTSKTDNLQHVSMQSSFSNKKARRLFVPVYTTTFTYRGTVYRFVVNGTTAKVHGTRPFSANKLASIGMTGIGAVFGLITSRLS
jgi:hypothetical protein